MTTKWFNETFMVDSAGGRHHASPAENARHVQAVDLTVNGGKSFGGEIILIDIIGWFERGGLKNGRKKKKLKKRAPADLPSLLWVNLRSFSLPHPRPFFF
jgi:hypothetical protein